MRFVTSSNYLKRQHFYFDDTIGSLCQIDIMVIMKEVNFLRIKSVTSLERELLLIQNLSFHMEKIVDKDKFLSNKTTNSGAVIDELLLTKYIGEMNEWRILLISNFEEIWDIDDTYVLEHNVFEIEKKVHFSMEEVIRHMKFVFLLLIYNGNNVIICIDTKGINIVIIWKDSQDKCAMHEYGSCRVKGHNGNANADVDKEQRHESACRAKEESCRVTVYNAYKEGRHGSLC